MRKPPPALVVDPDLSFLTGLINDPKAKSLPPITAQTGKSAQLALADTTQRFCGVFVNPKVAEPHGLSVVRFSHYHRPSTPIYLIHEKESPPLVGGDIRSLGIQKCLEKPVTYGQLMDLVMPAQLLVDPKEALREAAPSADKVDQELTAQDAEFVPIRAENYIAGTVSYFDVYVRLSSGRYVKILQAGDEFSADRVANYLRKGVQVFFLRKEQQERYLAYCDTLTQFVQRAAKVTPEIKVKQTLNLGQETMSFLRTAGLSATHMQYASGFVGSVQELTKQLRTDKNQNFRKFMDDVSAFEHGVSTSMIASLLLVPLAIESERPVQVVGMAAMFHDIGLTKLPPEVAHEDMSKMADDQRAIYKTHPQVGAQMLQEIRGVDMATVQAVAQHHARRDGTGFPSGIGVGAVGIAAEVVGISDEFARLISKAKENPKINPYDEMEKTVFNGFSYKVVEAFRSVFGMRRSDPLVGRK